MLLTIPRHLECPEQPPSRRACPFLTYNVKEPDNKTTGNTTHPVPGRPACQSVVAAAVSRCGDHRCGETPLGGPHEPVNNRFSFFRKKSKIGIYLSDLRASLSAATPNLLRLKRVFGESRGQNGENQYADARGRPSRPERTPPRHSAVANRASEAPTVTGLSSLRFSGLASGRVNGPLRSRRHRLPGCDAIGEGQGRRTKKWTCRSPGDGTAHI